MSLSLSPPTRHLQSHCNQIGFIIVLHRDSIPRGRERKNATTTNITPITFSVHPPEPPRTSYYLQSSLWSTMVYSSWMVVARVMSDIPFKQSHSQPVVASQLVLSWQYQERNMAQMESPASFTHYWHIWDDRHGSSYLTLSVCRLKIDCLWVRLTDEMMKVQSEIWFIKWELVQLKNRFVLHCGQPSAPIHSLGMHTETEEDMPVEYNIMCKLLY